MIISPFLVEDVANPTSFTGTGSVEIKTLVGRVPSEPCDKLNMFALV
jgi:hypothetical protein